MKKIKYEIMFAKEYSYSIKNLDSIVLNNIKIVFKIEKFICWKFVLQKNQLEYFEENI